MLSILLPKDIQLYVYTLNPSTRDEKISRFLKIEGPKGSFIKKRGDFSLSQLYTIDGSRIFVSGVSSQKGSQILGQLWKQAIGLSLGYRKRLRLIGIGFRATLVNRPEGVTPSKPSLNLADSINPRPANAIKEKSLLVPKHIKRRIPGENKTASPSSRVLLKLGYSHDSGFPIKRAETKKIKVDVSRPDGRTKGTVISLEGGDLSEISSTASVIQNYRLPDIYKGKGIHTDGRKLKLKKGKRQG